MQETWETVNQLSSYEFLGNSVKSWAAAVLLAAVAFAVLGLLKVVLVRRAKVFARSRINGLDQVVEYVVRSTKKFFLLLIALMIGAQLVDLPQGVARLLRSAVVLGSLVQLAIWGNYLIQFWVIGYAQKEMDSDAAKATTVRFTGALLKLAFWSVLLLFALDNLGVNVSALVAGLGIGGIAVGLAAQNILGDLFASLAIVLDKPFVLGDFIITGTEMGTIEKIGIKTTRVRSLSGEQLIFPNSNLVSSRIRNYKRMEQRRILFSFGVVYQTSYEQLERIPGMVREIIEAQELTRFDRAHFHSYGDSALNFEVVYYVLAADYNTYMDIQQAINLELFKRLAEEGIKFAHPTRTLYVTHLNASGRETERFVPVRDPGASPI